MPFFVLMIRRPPRSTLFPYTSSSDLWSANGFAPLRLLPSRYSRTSGAANSASRDRKSTRLNSSHGYISYAVFCFNDTATTEIYTLSLHELFRSVVGEWIRPIAPFTLEVLADKRRCKFRFTRSEEHTSELQSRLHLVCRFLF